MYRETRGIDGARDFCSVSRLQVGYVFHLRQVYKELNAYTLLTLNYPDRTMQKSTVKVCLILHGTVLVSVLISHSSEIYHHPGCIFDIEQWANSDAWIARESATGI